MRTTLNLANDALLVAKQLAARNRMSLGEAVSHLVRAGAGANPAAQGRSVPLRGRFALLPQRGEIVTPEHVRELMESPGT